MKVMPLIGYVFVLAAAPEMLKRKGYFFGMVAVALDLLPVICLVKAGIEIFTGDLIPNREDQQKPQLCTRRLEAVTQF
ncbi:MAG: hypothetical protein ACKVX9_12940 [Blastocatellia bacterium]